MSTAVPASAPSTSRRRLALGAVAAATLLAGVLVPATPASAAATTRWVDPAAASAAPGTGCDAAAGYATIASAVAAAAAGDEIRVCAGDYSEGKIAVNTANLSFYGAQAGVSAGVGSARSEAPAAQESNVNVEFTFNKPFTVIDGFSFSSANRAVYAMGAADGGSVVNNRFVNTTRGVASYGDLVEVSNNLFADSSWGVHHDDSGTIGGLVSGNVFRNLSYAVSSAAHDLELRGNVVTAMKQRAFTLYGYNLTIADNTVDFPSTAAGEGALMFTGSARNATVTGNTFTGGGTSIYVTSPATAVVERNSLLGTGLSVVGTTGPAFAVGPNWWGSASGPYNGLELDATRATNVTVASWCADAACTTTRVPAAAPAAPPAADGDALDDLNLPDVTNQFSGADLSSIDVSQPLSGELPWSSDEDDWVDVYAYSTPIYIGTFPVVNGKVQLTGVDLSALEAGKHRLVFIGQTSGATSVAAFAITEAAEEGSRLAASGATDALPVGIAAALSLIAGLALVLRHRRRVTA